MRHLAFHNHTTHYDICVLGECCSLFNNITNKSPARGELNLFIHKTSNLLFLKIRRKPSFKQPLSLNMKMPGNQQTDNGIYEYDENSYFSEGLENNGVEEFNSPPEDDFSEYLWMENEEEFDKEVLQRLEEEALMEQCIEAMLDDENNDNPSSQTSNNQESGSDVSSLINDLKLDCSQVAKESNLNPLAAEFVPGAASSVTTGSF